MTQALEPWSLTERIAQAQEARDLQEAGRIIEIKQKLEPWYDRVVSYVVHKLGQELGVPVTVEQYRYIVSVHGKTTLERCESELEDAQSKYGTVTVIMRAFAQDLQLLVHSTYHKPNHEVRFGLAVPRQCVECGHAWNAGRRVHSVTDLKVYEPIYPRTSEPMHWWGIPKYDDLILGLGDRLKAAHYKFDRIDREWIICTDYQELYHEPRSLAPPQPQPLPSASESPIEEMFWQACQRSMSPEIAGLVQQYVVGSYRLDLALPGLRVGIELDGYEWHSERHQFVRDRARQRTLELAGWRVIRFAGSEVHKNADDCVRQLVAFVQTIRGQT